MTHRLSLMLGTAMVATLCVASPVSHAASAPQTPASARASGLAADRSAERVEKMGLASRFFADVDAIGAASLRWEFPRLEAMQLAVGEPLVFALPGGETVALPLVERNWIAEDAIGLSFSDPAAGGWATIVLSNGAVTGSVHAIVRGVPVEWSLATGTDNAGIAGEYFAPLAPSADPIPPTSVEAPAGESGGGGDGGVAGNGCDDSGALIDVLFAYTPIFRAQFPTLDDMKNAILADMQRANLAMVSSLSAPRFRSAGFFQMNVNGTGALAGDLEKVRLTTDGWGDNVHVERNNARADLVALFSDSPGESVAYLGVGNQAFGFSAVGKTNSYALARALATNMGCCNAAGDVPACTGAFSFSQAYRFTVGTSTYRTLLANAPGVEIPYFSNPEVNFLGVPTGTDAANNARTMSLTSATVASYRCSTGPSPDCDGDGILDSLAIQNGIVPDCNRTGIPDSCDIVLGISQDLNGNGVPDECPLVDSQLVPPGAAVLDTVGSAVSVSLNPSDPAVLYGFGGPGNDVPGFSNAGAAWLLPVTAGVPNPALFRVVRASDPQTNAFFGRGLSVFKRPASTTPAYPAANLACIAAHRWTSSGPTGLYPSMGKVYLFEETTPGNWAQTRSYAPPPSGNNAAGANALFGYSLAMGRNPAETSETIIVGAPGRLNAQGGVYVLRNTATALQFNVFRALSGPVDGDQHGFAVALLPAFQVTSGNRVAFAVGAPGRSSNRGFVQVYERTATATSFGVWQNPITVAPTSPALAVGDRFGASLAMVARPTAPPTAPTALLVVGAPGDSGGRGRVHFFERGLGTGAAQWAYRGSYAPPDVQIGDGFGSSVGVSLAAAGGDFIITVGAPKAEVTVGSAVRTDAGKIYILRHPPASVNATLVAVRTAFSPASGDEFGSSAAAVRGFGVVGAPFNDSAGLNVGLTRITVNP